MFPRTYFKKIFGGCLLAVLLFPFPGLFAAEGFDHSSWDVFLKKFVNEKGEVNYQAVKRDPSLLEGYLTKVKSVDGSAIDGWIREEKIAFWLNAYNAALIKQVIESYPVKTVQQIPSFWDITVVRLKSEDKNKMGFSLNDIRRKALLDVFHDEKIHLALSLAAKGGPRLSREAFTGAKVEGQLFLITRQFVKDPSFVDVEPGRKKIRISRLFKWYGQDFKLDFGITEPLEKFSPSETAVLSFLAFYLEDEPKKDYLQEARFKIEYPPFDWSLNEWKGSVS